MKMNKQVVYIGLGAVVAYLLYNKFVTKSETKSTEAEAIEEGASEEAPSGGGGGGGAAAPTESVASPSATAPVEKSMTSTKAASIKPTSVSGLSAVAKPRNYGTAQRPTTTLTSTRPMATATRPVTSVSRPSVRVNPKLSGRLATTRPVAATTRFAGFMDFDANNDVLGSLM
jgi:hypothetical protein